MDSLTEAQVILLPLLALRSIIPQKQVLSMNAHKVGGFPGGSVVKKPPARQKMQETQV